MSKNQLGFRGMHPICALAFLIFVFTVSMASSHPLLLFTNFFTAIMGDASLKAKKTYRMLFRVLIPMLLLITLFNSIYNHYGVTVFFQTSNGNNFTLEALVYGFVFAMKACTAILWLDFIGEVFQSDKVIFIFGGISPRLALIISMVLRFLPLIRKQADEIKAAQKGLGFSYANGFYQKMRAAAHRLSILISWTLERGIDTSDSMRARGYGLKHRTIYNRYSFSPLDGIVLGSTVIALALFFLSKDVFLSVYNPIITIPFPTVFGWIAYSGILCALLLPFLIELFSQKSLKSNKNNVAQTILE